MLKKTEILLVDDREENLIALEKILSSLDATFIKTMSGDEALAATLEHEFALALVDIQMPGMDGFELVQILQEDEKTRLLPVIFVSAIYKNDYYQIKGIETGAVDFITKPIIPEILLGKVSVFLELYDQRKRIENIAKEKEKLNIELIEKNKELEQIIYVISHDLRSPLVNIQGFSRELDTDMSSILSILSADTITPEDREILFSLINADIPESLKYIFSSINKMDMLLTGLLKLSRLGQKALEIKEIDMNSLIAGVAEDFEFQIKEENIELNIGHLPSCKGDLTQINQVMSNLLDNAIKYLDPGRRGIINIYGRAENAHSVYCVEDNGIGIDDKDKKIIFEIFHRLHPHDSQGQGLGLNIIGKILERHSGKIWVESRLGTGSKFFISLPGSKK